MLTRHLVPEIKDLAVRIMYDLVHLRVQGRKFVCQVLRQVFVICTVRLSARL